MCVCVCVCVRACVRACVCVCVVNICARGHVLSGSVRENVYNLIIIICISMVPGPGPV